MGNKIALGLGEKSYDILVGNGEINQLSNFLEQDYSKIFVISDENVANLHFDKIEKSLNGRDFEKIIVKPGESSKSFAVLENICEEILDKKIDRKSLIIAFGGGCVGDLAGFAASILLRGIDFVQIPTTLLAMVDSSVGGKTAVNAKSGKNLVGSFYQPKLVICDLDFLTTLPRREIHAGYAEILKYGLIYDADFFEFLDENFTKIFALNNEFLQIAVLKSCQIKAEIVGQDEKEKGVRALLNFGHTFAHAFEAQAGYGGNLNHGEAVGIGMLMAAKMSRDLGFLGEENLTKITKHIEKSGLDIDLAAMKKWDEEQLVTSLYKDKKTQNNRLNFVLVKEIGAAFVQKDVEVEGFLKVVSEFI